MASLNTSGYDTEFLDPPAKLKELECPLCLLVTREPNQTSCCGQHFCQNCINQILTDRKSCPIFKENTFTVLLDKKQNYKVLEMKVRCSMEKRGCGWTGELGELATHTDTRNGDCQFVDVVCPNNCGETHQKRYLHSHISDTCLKQLFLCEYCRFKSTYELVCKHYDECAKFPLKCPNKCEIASVEQGKMKEHLSECPLQLVECEYAYAGCSEHFQRRDLAAHMGENVQEHLLWAFAASQKQIVALERKIEEVRKEKNEQLEAVKHQLDEVQRRKDAQIEELKLRMERVLVENNKLLEEKDQQIELLHVRVSLLEEPSVSFSAPNYYQKKRRGLRVESPTFYTPLGGAVVQLIVYYGPYGIDCELHQLPGEFSAEIKWPLRCRATVHLLNHLSNRGHISKSETFILTRPQDTRQVENVLLFVEYSKIEYSQPQVRYLQDNTLRFKATMEQINV